MFCKFKNQICEIGVLLDLEHVRNEVRCTLMHGDSSQRHELFLLTVLFALVLDYVL